MSSHRARTKADALRIAHYRDMARQLHRHVAAQRAPDPVPVRRQEPRPHPWPIVDRDLPAFAGDLSNIPDRVPTSSPRDQGSDGPVRDHSPGASSVASMLPLDCLACQGVEGQAGRPTWQGTTGLACPASTRYTVRWSA